MGYCTVVITITPHKVTLGERGYVSVFIPLHCPSLKLLSLSWMLSLSVPSSACFEDEYVYKNKKIKPLWKEGPTCGGRINNLAKLSVGAEFARNVFGRLVRGFYS